MVEESIGKVTEFLRKGKADLIGEFTTKSRTTQHKYEDNEPSYWKSVLEAASESTSGRCLVMSFSSENSKISEYYMSDLFLSSEDLNTNYFHKKLAKSLIRESSVIYIEVNKKLTIRGSERLLSMLKDMKKLFDNRVKVFIVKYKKPLSLDIRNLVDVDVDVDCSGNLEPPSKKLKTKKVDDLVTQKEQVLLDEKEKKEARLENEKKELREEIAELRKRSKEEYDKISVELKETKTKVHGLNVILQQKEVNEDTMESEKKVLRESKGSLKEELKDSKLYVQNLLELLKEKEENEAKLEIDNNAVRVKLEEVKRKLEEGETKSKMMLVEKDRIELEMEKSNHALKRSLKEVTSDLNDKAGKLTVIEVELSDANREIEELTMKTKSLESEVIKLGEQVSSSIEESTSTTTEMLTLQTTDNLIKDAEVAGDLKMKILELDEKFPNAGPSEILHRCCKKLEYEAHFLDKKKSSPHYVCLLRIKSKELMKYHDKQFEGKGISKAVAKSNAMEALLNLIKC